MIAPLCTNPDRPGCLSPVVFGSDHCRRCMIEVAAKRRPGRVPLPAPLSIARVVAPVVSRSAFDAIAAPPVAVPAQPPAAPRALPPRRRAAPRRDGPLSNAEMILVAALPLAVTWTVPDLVVSSWKHWPKTFALGTYEHPDSNRVNSKLHGATGLVGNGYVDNLGGGLFTLTRDGRRRANEAKGAHERSFIPESMRGDS